MLIESGYQVAQQSINLQNCMKNLLEANQRVVEASVELSAIKAELKACRQELKRLRASSYTDLTGTPSGSGLSNYFNRNRR